MRDLLGGSGDVGYAIRYAGVAIAVGFQAVNQEAHKDLPPVCNGVWFFLWDTAGWERVRTVRLALGEQWDETASR